MHQERSLSLDLVALALLALVVFLAVALLSYHPADPLPTLASPFDQLYVRDMLVYPIREHTDNLCGSWGALVSDILLNAFGLGSYYFVVSLAILDVVMLRRWTIQAPVLRLSGWLLSITGLTAAITLLIPGLSPGPVIGAGGYLGALTCAFLETHFALAGGLILAISATVAGLLLCTDYVLLGAAAVGLGIVQQGWQRARGRHTVVAEEELDDEYEAEEEWDEDTDNEHEEEEYEEEEYEEEEEVPIRIKGQPAAAPTEDSYDEESEYEEDAEEEELSETAGSTGDRNTKPADKEATKSDSFRTRVASALGIQKPEDPSRQELMEELEAASQNDEPENYELPPIDLLLPGDNFSYTEQKKEVRRKAKILERTFESFGFQVKVVEVDTGPVIAQYEVELPAGLRLSRITGLSDDLAIALRVPSVRIVAPIPGKNTVGIEVPNEQRQLVRLRDVMEELDEQTRKMRIPLFLGKDVSGNPLAVDLSTLPHLLIAGRTGTGKSVCLNAIISSILMTRRPDEVRMLMIDPKMVELCGYKTLPHLMHPVVTDMRKAEAILAWAVEKMEERYALLARAGVRHVSVYNQLGEEELMDRLEPVSDEERKAIPLHLPFIVIVADEMADLMMTAGKEVEQHIIRLAQKSRAVGIHLILATQKPTVDVITGLIKSNLPARIAFQVASRTDSRVVLDEMGADKLLGNGDMLFLWPGTSTLLRGQGTYLGDDEIDRIVDCVSTGEQHFVQELIQMKVEDQQQAEAGPLKNRDELYAAAVEIVVNERRGSVSLLQRALGIGYGRAARLIDFMAEDGIVGAYAGSQAREVLVSQEEALQMLGSSKDTMSAQLPVAPVTLHTPSASTDAANGGIHPPAQALTVDATSVKLVSSVSSDDVDAQPPWEENEEEETVESTWEIEKSDTAAATFEEVADEDEEENEDWEDQEMGTPDEPTVNSEEAEQNAADEEDEYEAEQNAADEEDEYEEEKEDLAKSGDGEFAETEPAEVTASYEDDSEKELDNSEPTGEAEEEYEDEEDEEDEEYEYEEDGEYEYEYVYEDEK